MSLSTIDIIVLVVLFSMGPAAVLFAAHLLHSARREHEADLKRTDEAFARMLRAAAVSAELEDKSRITH